MFIKMFSCASLCFLFSFSMSHATSISERTAYPAFCQSAADDDQIFANFKRNPNYQQILEHVSYDQGLQYLDVIVKEYPELIPYFDRFRENDSMGNPITYSYGEYGVFSPTTLRYIKMAGDIKQKFGDISQMHIVEIGAGYGGLCKVLSFLGFASFTLIDLPEVVALEKKYLQRQNVFNVHYIDSHNLKDVGTYDLVISNFSFSEIDQKEQLDYLEKVITPTPNGYFTMNYISHYFNLKSLSLEELVSFLYFSGKSGKVEKEIPVTGGDNVLITWKIPKASSSSNCSFPCYTPSSGGNSVSYSFSGGRFGDNLIAYFHAKWVAYKFELPFLYAPFPFSDQLAMDDIDLNLKGFSFSRQITIADEKEILAAPKDNTLLIVPYSPECRVDYAALPSGWLPYIKVDWEDFFFRDEIIRCLTPKHPVKTLELPSDIITVGVHVRRGGGHDNYEHERWRVPLKFPPDSYYIEQIRRVAEIFKDQSLYVYIFTDDLNPQNIVKHYKKSLKNPRLIFGCRAEGNNPNSNIFEDFYSIKKFDCFIRCQSNFSIMATYLSQHSLLIAPLNYAVVNNEIVVNETEITFRNN